MAMKEKPAHCRTWLVATTVLLLVLAVGSSRLQAADGPSWDYPEVTWFEWDAWRWQKVVDDADWEDVDDDGTAEYVGRAEDDDLDELAEHIGSTDQHADEPANRSVWARWDDSSRHGWSDQDYDPAPADADSVGANDPRLIPDSDADGSSDDWDDVDWSGQLAE